MFDKTQDELLRKILRVDEKIKDYLEILVDIQLNKRPNSLQIRFGIQEPGMPVTLSNTPTASVVGTPVETNADGSLFTIDPTKVTWDVQDATVASFVQNPDGTATFKPLKVGVTQVGVSDSATSLSATDTLTVVAAGPTSMSINWGAVTNVKKA